MARIVFWAKLSRMGDYYYLRVSKRFNDVLREAYEERRPVKVVIEV